MEPTVPGAKGDFHARIRQVEAVEATNVKPVISHALPLERAADACAIMDHGGHFGKICSFD